MVNSSDAAAFSKARLRKVIKYQLAEVHGRLDSFPAEALREFLKMRAGAWAAFQPISPEPPILEVVQSQTHLDWVFPRVDGEQMYFHRAQGDGWKVGPLGMLEPLASTPIVPISKIEGALIPGIAFDRTGRRLGRGKGYYDRFLQSWQGIAVGVCWSEALVDAVPEEPHDVGVAWVATESEMIEAARVKRKE